MRLFLRGPTTVFVPCIYDPIRLIELPLWREKKSKMYLEIAAHRRKIQNVTTNER